MAGKRKGIVIDYIFPRYQLWVRYSGLPAKLGVGPWGVFQRLLELMERFESNEFYYGLERLGETTGVNSRFGMRKIIKRLAEEEELIECITQHGRGQKAKFRIILPIKTPIPEEEVYRDHPRLRPKSYIEKLGERNGNGIALSGERNGNGIALSGERNGNGIALSGNKVAVLGEMGGASNPIAELLCEDIALGPKKIKRSIYKKDNNNNKDLFYKKEKDREKDKSTYPIYAGEKSANILGANPKAEAVVVASYIRKLKEYGISGADAERFLKNYPEAYLTAKMEIIDYKKHSGEKINNIGGMLRKAIIEDWQPPAGFKTAGQQEEEEKRKKEEELAAREAREAEERIKQQRDRETIAEEWKRTASLERLKEIKERARQEIIAENPKTKEQWLGTMIRFRENKIIADEYLSGDA